MENIMAWVSCILFFTFIPLFSFTFCTMTGIQFGIQTSPTSVSFVLVNFRQNLILTYTKDFSWGKKKGPNGPNLPDLK
jgi:hypothetical protein